MPLVIKREPADNQLLEYAKNNQGEVAAATTTSGNPLVDKDASLTVGPRGPILLEDFDMIDEQAHFNRERIPERVVHAKGAGAFGYFEVTNDITQYSAAKVFSSIGKKTPIAMRFSQVIRETGSADTVRDPRGFAIKFRTEDGIWDLVGNNTPVFFVRDTILFPSCIHALKRNPTTNLRDWDMYWDFFSLRPETMHQLLIMYSDRGIPDGYRRMHGYGSNTFSFVNDGGQLNYCKFHCLSGQGIRNIPSNQADIIAGLDADYSVRDLYNAIAKGDYPFWTMNVQIMTPKQANEVSFNPFDVTKTWPHADFPLIPVGRLVLNRNPTNYFAEVEQLAFSPSHLIPGIEASPDRNLQGRLFAYNDAHKYRLGVNNQQLEVNCPFRVSNFSRSGLMTIDSQGGAPVYHPNSFRGAEVSTRARALAPAFSLIGEARRFDIGEEDNYSQPRILVTVVLPRYEGANDRLVTAIVGDLSRANTVIQDRMIGHLLQVDDTFGARVRDGIRQMVKKQANL